MTCAGNGKELCESFNDGKYDSLEERHDLKME
jgi:hypothetical protein